MLLLAKRAQLRIPLQVLFEQIEQFAGYEKKSFRIVLYKFIEFKIILFLQEIQVFSLRQVIDKVDISSLEVKLNFLGQVEQMKRNNYYLEILSCWVSQKTAKLHSVHVLF